MLTVFLIRLLLESWDKAALGNQTIVPQAHFGFHEPQIPWLLFLGHHVLSLPAHIIKKLSVVSLDSLPLD